MSRGGSGGLGDGGGHGAGRDGARVPNGELFDPGLQPERTALAWLRTSLVMTVGSVVGLRVLPSYWGPVGLVIAGAGALASMALIGLAVRRYRLTQHRLPPHRLPRHPSDRPNRDLSARAGPAAEGPTTGAVPDGRLPAVVAGLSLIAALVAAALVLSAALG